MREAKSTQPQIEQEVTEKTEPSIRADLWPLIHFSALLRSLCFLLFKKGSARSGICLCRASQQPACIDEGLAAR
jgi:hypothetical protein